MQQLSLKVLQLLRRSPCSRAPVAAQCLLVAAQQRCYQAAVDSSESHQVFDQDSIAPAGIGKEQLQWAPRRSLPPPSVYSVRVVIKAHDLKFVKMASTVIRDLMLVNFSPKSRDTLSSHLNKGNPLPWVQLAMPAGDFALPIKRTHYTVIRSPHVHKTSREQFARTTHKRVISYATNNLSELNWFLDSVKLYQFQAVELVVKVTSSSYLLPTSAAEQAAAEQPLLQQHKQRFAHLFGAAAPSSTRGGSSSSSLQTSYTSNSGSYAAVHQSLQGLKQAMHDGLLQQRIRLGSSTAYQRWREGLQGSNAAAAAAAAAVEAGALPGQQLEDVTAQQVHGSGLLAQQEEQQQQQQQDSVQQAFMAAVDKVLLGLKLDVLDKQKFFPYLMAFYSHDDKVSAAEWMQAMLKYGQYRQREVESSQQAVQAVQALQQYSRVSQALALLLLQQWHQAADSGSRKQLALPDAETIDEVLALQQQRRLKN